MNFKRITLKYKFFFQVAIFIVYVALLSCIFLFVVNRIQKDRDVSILFQKLHSQVSTTHLNYQNFLHNTSEGNIFFRDGENSYTLEFHRSIDQIRDSLNAVKNRTCNEKRMTEATLFDSIISALNDYQAEFRHTILLFKELGDQNTGKTFLLLNSSRKLTALLKETDIPEISSFSDRLLEQQSDYLINPGKTKYNEIIFLLDDLQYHPALSEIELQPLLIPDIGQEVERYKNCLEGFQLTVDRLKGKNKDSAYTMMETKLTRLHTTFNNLIQNEQSLLKNKIRWMILMGLVLIIILTVLYLVQFIAFYKQINQSLNTLTGYSYDLAKGKIPESTLKTDVPQEISRLNENMNTLSRTTQEKKLFVESLLKQKFDRELNLQGKNDTFGKTLIALKENLRKANEEQNKHAEDNKLRRYQNEGLAKFSEILRNNSDNLDKLSDIFIKEIVKYLEAIQGGLFLIEEKTKVLLLTSAFAYNRKKYLSKTIKLGEGLVGTCAVEKKIINLRDIPEDYIEITSGLGDAPPNNLLLLPVMHDEQVIGVLEIASLKPFNSNQITLIEKITESLASTIINARINSQTSELLKKSQQQAAEMAEQEEEMRQNMEELKATQEESARREEELESVLHAIDQSFYVLEYDIEGVVTKVNQRFLYLVNLHSDKVLGLKHTELFGKKSKADSQFFANISEGNTVELVETVVVNKKMLEIKNTFSPVRKKEGETLRILNIMTVVI